MSENGDTYETYFSTYSWLIIKQHNRGNGNASESVCLQGPYTTLNSNAYRIRAHLNKAKIGSIHYKRSQKKPNEWEITKLFVEVPHRHSDKKIGFCLFKACIGDIVTKIDKIEWTVVSQDPTISLPELNIIYQKMVAKLALPSVTFTSKHFGHATEMALIFKAMERS